MLNHMLATFLTPLVRYADFQGRSRRAEYWLFKLLALSTLLFVLTWVPPAIEHRLPFPALGLWIIVFAVPLLAVTVRRFHDQGRSGWLLPFCLALAYALQPFGGLVLIGFMLIDVTPGSNFHGLDPRGPRRVF